MQILLASAKIMNSSSSVEVPLMRKPTYKDVANKFALELSSWDSKRLMKELKCSQAIALENLQRYQSFWNESEQMPAILAYFGQAYKYLKADDGILIHLATEEFEHLLDWKRVKEEVKVIHPLFYVDKDDTIKVVSVHAKSCRGAMSRYIIQNKITKPLDLQSFELESFKYDKDYGDETHPHFIKK